MYQYNYYAFLYFKNSNIEDKADKNTVEELVSNLTNSIRYNSETDSLDIYENGVLLGSINQLGIKSTIKYYTHSSSGSTRTLTLSENWASISSVKVISGGMYW